MSCAVLSHSYTFHKRDDIYIPHRVQVHSSAEEIVGEAVDIAK